MSDDHQEASGMDNPIVHWELLVSDLAKAKEFYANVFGWKVEDSPAFPGYPMIDPGQEPKGAMMVKPPETPGYTVNVYFGVSSVDQALSRAVTAGGTLIAPAMTIEGVGEWGMFADPDGIRIGVFSPKQM
jgi:uncharacterized protein